MQAKQLGGDTSRGWRSWSQRFDAEAEQVGARSKVEALVREIFGWGKPALARVGACKESRGSRTSRTGTLVVLGTLAVLGMPVCCSPSAEASPCPALLQLQQRAFNEVLQTRLCRAGGRGGDPVTHILGSPRAAPSSPQPPRAALAGDSCDAPGRDRAAGTGTVHRHRRGYPISQHRLEHPQSQGSIIFR